MNLTKARDIWKRLNLHGSPLSLEAADAIAWALKPKPVKKPTKKRAKSPAKGKAKSQSEIEDFCLSIGLPASDAEYLWLHWSENGWKNGSRVIKDWKLTVRKWKSIGVLPKLGNSGKPKVKGDHNDGF